MELFAAEIGIGVVIKPRVNIHFPWKLRIGDYPWLGEEVFILNFECCEIGSNCCISQRAFICGGNHDYRDLSLKYRNGPVKIEDQAWVGAQVFVAPGVTIGQGAVIAAGSVVTTSLKGGIVYSGNPALAVRPR